MDPLLPPGPPDPLPDDLRTWLRDQPDAADLERAWAAAAHAVPALSSSSTAAARARLDARLDAGTPGRADVRSGADRPARRASDRPTAGRRRWAVFAGAAAALAACVVVAVGVWQGQTVTAEARGAVLAVVLPDASAVTLSPGSRLSYRRRFGAGARDVTLAGEAFFAVAHDAARPFTVVTGDARVTVLGTRFSVRAWGGPSGAETAVVVEQGRVRVAALAGARQSVVLTPGRRAVVGPSGRPAAGPVDVAAAMAWRRAAFAVYDAPLGVIAIQIQRAFGTPVRLGAGVDSQQRVTAMLPRADDAEDVVTDLAASLGYRVRPRAGGFDLFP